RNVVAVLFFEHLYAGGDAGGDSGYVVDIGISQQRVFDERNLRRLAGLPPDHLYYFDVVAGFDGCDAPVGRVLRPARRLGPAQPDDLDVFTAGRMLSLQILAHQPARVEPVALSPGRNAIRGDVATGDGDRHALVGRLGDGAVQTGGRDGDHGDAVDARTDAVFHLGDLRGQFGIAAGGEYVKSGSLGFGLFDCAVGHGQVVRIFGVREQHAQAPLLADF